MLKSIKLQNFFSFGYSPPIELHPKINVLVGINGSGKSNFFKAVRLIKEFIDTNGIGELFFEEWAGRRNIVNSVIDEKNIELLYKFDESKLPNYDPSGANSESNDLFYKLTLNLKGDSDFTVDEYIYRPFQDHNEIEKSILKTKSGTGFDNNQFAKLEAVKSKKSTLLFLSDRYEAFLISTAIDFIDIYSFFDTSPNSKIRAAASRSNSKKLYPDGSNLVGFLSTLKINDKASFGRIMDAFCSVNPNYKSFDFIPIGNKIEMLLEENALNSSVYLTHISDGTIKFLCLLTILYNPYNDGSLICIDEPETGLHPDMISTIADAIKYCSEKNQVIISTHSDHLLNEFELENIRVFEKDENNCTVVNSFTEEEFKSWEGRFSMGRMWRNGELGGNRW